MIIKSKDDLEGVKQLKLMSKEEILHNKTELLRYLQDMNWPIAIEVAKVLQTYTNDLEDEIIRIVTGKDSEWKHWVTIHLLFYSKEKISDRLIKAMEYKVNNPTDSEIIDEYVDECREVLEKWSNGSNE